jgi:RecA/RadA recombinase
LAKKKETLENVISDYLDSSYILDNPGKIISISPAMDLVLSGGIPQGTISTFESEAKIGKTTIALKCAAKAQQQYDSTVIYVMVENRKSGLAKNLTGTPGLNLEKNRFKLIASEPGKILSTEHFLEQTERAISEHPECVVIFDSFSALSSSDEKTKEYGAGYNLLSRKLEGEFCHRVSPLLSTTNATILGIAHVSNNINTMGKSVKISSALKYQLDVRISMKKCYPAGDWIESEKLIGQKISVEIITSALGSPGGKCNIWHKYGSNFLDEAELAEMAIDLDIISKAGAGWFTLPEKYDVKMQGFSKLVNYFIDNPTIYNEILTEVKSLLS